MGYGVTPFAVDMEALKSILGSNDEKLLAEMLEAWKDEFENVDEMAADYFDPEDEIEAVTMADALTHMVRGQEYGEPGFVYGYALEFICRCAGEMLNNREWSAMPRGTEWMDTVDEQMAAAGIPNSAVSAASLFFSGSPIELPDIEDNPSIGYMTVAQMRTAVEALTIARIEAIADKDAAKSALQLREWFETCIARNHDLITFYY